MEKTKPPLLQNPVPEVISPDHTWVEKPAGRDCDKCSFFGVLSGGKVGICRYNPPTVTCIAVPSQAGGVAWLTQTAWPSAGPGQWCGKFANHLDS